MKKSAIPITSIKKPTSVQIAKFKKSAETRQGLHGFSPWTKKSKQTSPKEVKQSSIPPQSLSPPPQQSTPLVAESHSSPQQSTPSPDAVSHSSKPMIPSLMSITFSSKAIQSFQQKLHYLHAKQSQPFFTSQTLPLVQPLMSIIQPLMSLVQTLQQSLHHLMFIHHNSLYSTNRRR